MKKLIFILTATIILSIACSKENDSENPVITITSPTEGSMSGIGDSILIAFTITDADMHGYEIAVTNTANSAVIFEADEHTHGNVTYSQKFKSPAAATQMQLTVTGEDHNGNTSTKSVNFHSM